jgi:tetratricopeptide (TPR) repeat protein
LFTRRFYVLIAAEAIETMNDIDRIIVAAQGYVELGLFDEARRMRQPLGPEVMERADVIELELLCLMGEQRWSEALAAAHQLCTAAPSQAGGYIHAAYCLHELGRTAEALDVLQGGPKSLKSKSVYYYNIGCYKARLGQIDHALQFLEIAFEKDKSLRRLARRDPDLAALRSQLL